MNKRIIHTVFENQVRLTPANIAISANGKKLTYSELNQLANQVAYRLRSLGLQKEDIVSVFAPTGINLIVLFLGVLKSGGVYMPMDIGFAKKQLEYALRETSPRYYLMDKGWSNEVKSLLTESDLNSGYTIVLDENSRICESVKTDEWNKPGSNSTETLYIDSHLENLSLVSEPQDGNYIFHTSGSTGSGKAVLGCHDSLSHFIHWEIKEFNIDSDCRVGQLSQHTFDASLRDILVPLCAGATLCIPPDDSKENVAKLVRWIDDEAISIVHTVPSYFRVIAREMVTAKASNVLKHVFLAGEYITVQDIVNWQNATGRDTEYINLYGATEATMAKTFHRIKNVTGNSANAIHAGKPISNTIVAIINDADLCGPGEIGEIYIITPFLTKGYYKDKKKTKISFVQNPLVKNRKEIVYKTGDYGYYLADQSIYVKGRLDDQVKINGVRVELNEVKEAISLFPGVEETEVTVFKDRYLQNSLVCYLVGKEVNTDLLKIYLGKELNRNIIPSHFIVMSEFPRTINGKVDKKALPAPNDSMRDDDLYEAPLNETELKLESMCKDLLNLNRVGRHISFFKIGGTSLKALQYISCIYREFHLSLNLRNIFENESIAQLAAFIAKADGKSIYEEIPNVAIAAYYDLSHGQKRLWLTDQFQDEKLRYNMTYTSILKGSLNKYILQRVVDTLVQRHEILRTTFAVVDAVPRQKICTVEEWDSENKYIDLRQIENQEEKLQEILNDEAGFSFDLQNGPLFRVSLIQTENDTFYFVLSMHHIVSDGWSVELIVEELFKLFNAYTRGDEINLPALRLQYKDFASWQNQQLEGDMLKKLESYWVGQFADEPAPVMLPADFTNDNPFFLNGGLISFVIDRALTKKLEEVAANTNASLFMTLMASVKTLLNKYTGQQDIIVGTPAAIRNHPELENQVGLYVNVLPVRTWIRPETDNFSEVVQKVKKQLLGAIEHELYPYDLLIDKLGLTKGSSRFPLINVLVQSQLILSKPEESLEGLTVNDCPLNTLTSKVDITFNFKKTDNGIAAAIEYDAGMFRSSTIQLLIDNLIRIMEIMSMDEHITVAKIDMLKPTNIQAEEDSFHQLMMSVK